MSFKNYFQKTFGNQGLSEEQEKQALYNYYYDYTTLPNNIQPGQTITGTTTTAGSGSSLTSQQLQQLYQSMQTSSIVSSGFSSIWNRWGDKQKKALANVGFEYDKKTNEWVLRLSSEIRLPQLEGIMAGINGGDGKPSDLAILEMKKLKEQLIEKLTAKVILLELIKPRKIDDEE